jgi:hypothetical protein
MVWKSPKEATESAGRLLKVEVGLSDSEKSGRCEHVMNRQRIASTVVSEHLEFVVEVSSMHERVFCKC